MARCPTCNTEGCYNSGFTVDCVNEECHCYSEKQANLFSQERKTEPPGSEEKEELLDIDWGDTAKSSKIGYSLEDAPTWKLEVEIDADAPDWLWEVGSGRAKKLNKDSPHNVEDLESKGECILCDSGIPKKSFDACVVTDEKGHRMLARFPKVDARRVVTKDLPDWLWEVCSGLAKKLNKDPMDLTESEVMHALGKASCASCGAYECRHLTRRCRGS